MSLRLAEPADAAAMDAFLAQHAETSMYLRSNLARHGIGISDHPHATTFWIHEISGVLQGVLGRTNAGYLMAQAPSADASVWQAWATLLHGCVMRGMTGDDHQVRATLRALRLRVADFVSNQAEPMYRLDLSTLDAPDVDMRPPCEDDLAILADWYSNFLLDTGLVHTRDNARAQATTRARDAVAADSFVRLLVSDAVPVAMAAVNAQADTMVQVGGVFVPAHARNRGLGRKVTAGLLGEARAKGAKTAVLFANNPPAARAYEGIGFERIGVYRASVLKTPRALETVS